MEKSYAIMSPYFPPYKGGVSDYSKKLLEQFHQKNLKAKVYTLPTTDRKDNPAVIEIKYPSKASKLENLFLRDEITDILIEYTPKAFNEKLLGVNFWLVWSLLRLRKRFKIHLYAHETNYPFQLSKAGLILGPIHLIQFYLLCLLSHTISFSTHLFHERWSKRLPTKKLVMKTIPIGSNIVPMRSPGPQDHQKDQVIFFGSKHPTCLIGVARDMILSMHQTSPSTQFIIMGLKEKDIDLSQLKDKAHFTGYLSESEVTAYYLESKLSLMPLYDGVSTRRGTIMCSLAHGVPVITNKGYTTDQSINWGDFCYLIDNPVEHSAYSYASKVIAKDVPYIDHKKVYENYLNYFSWPHITDQLLTHMHGA